MADQIATPTEKAPVLTAEQKRMMKKIREVMPGGKVFEPKPNGRYYGEVLFANKDYLVQQVGSNTLVAHPRNQLGELPVGNDKGTERNLAKFSGSVIDVNYEGTSGAVAISNPDRWIERTARTPANDMATAVARSHLGQNVGVFNAPSPAVGLSTRYEGIVVAVNENQLIQRIDSRTALVHDVGTEVAKQFGAGQQVAVQYEQGNLGKVETIAKERTRGRDSAPREHGGERSNGRAQDPEAAHRSSFFHARKIVRDTYGSDMKIYDAAKVGQDPKFTGTVVAMTDHHVMQRISANKVIAHERSALSGDLKRGAFVEIAYAQGRAAAVEREVRRDRQAPSRSVSQGVSR
jgi:hypothetical protein